MKRRREEVMEREKIEREERKRKIGMERKEREEGGMDKRKSFQALMEQRHKQSGMDWRAVRARLMAGQNFCQKRGSCDCTGALQPRNWSIAGGF